MSVELDWAVLDEDLSIACQRFINVALSNAQRPSFLAEVSCTEFAFGDTAPDVELMDIRDIYEEFLEADMEADAELAAKEASYSDLASSAGWRGESRRVSPSLSGSLPARAGAMRPMMHGRSQSAAPYISVQTFPPSPPPEEDEPKLDPKAGISLQLHLRLTYSGALRLGIRTSLLVNHPAPGFLQLPLNLVVTGIAFRGTLVAAYEGGRKRVHLSLLDPGPLPAGPGSPPSSGHRTRPSERILTDMVCESEVGQADKHVLRNVGKVEKFVLDVVRGALEDEIIFPNFQTMAWGG